MVKVWRQLRNMAGVRVGVSAIVLTWVMVLGSSTSHAQNRAGSVDFDAALRGLNFDPAQIDGSGESANGMLDGDEMALVAAVLQNPSLNLKASGGVDRALVIAAVDQARASAAVDLRSLAQTYPTATDVTVGYSLLGKRAFDAFNAMTSGFGAPLKSDYSLALQLEKYLASDGDADGDGISNLQEYKAFIGQGRAAYLSAALDAAVKPSAAVVNGVRAPSVQTAAGGRKTLGIVLYPGFEVLDVFGPIEMWSYVPDFKVILISEQGGAVRSTQGVSVNSDFSFATAPPLDILMIPGGNGTVAQLLNPVLLDYLREQDTRTQFTTSVCTGSALLAKAGILKGHKATSNKNFFSLAVEQDPSVDWVVKARWVDDGKYVTSSGVSAGTDMALGLVARLYGKPRALALARSLEYEWHEDPTVDPFALSAVPHVSGR